MDVSAVGDVEGDLGEQIQQERTEWEGADGSDEIEP